MALNPLPDNDIQARLQNLQGWTYQDNALEKTYLFEDFVTAFSFLSVLAIESERADHHAEIFNVYHKVRLRLTTHDAGGVTDRDFRLIEKLDAHPLAQNAAANG